MAPALHDAARDAAPPPPSAQDRRRALASVDNVPLMDEDDMGLANAPNLVKDSQEMEQILVELGNGELGNADLLQAIKTLESGGDNLSTGDTDAIFPLSGFDLPDALESEGDAAEDKIRLLQARLERRCAFLQRRLRILQAQAIGKRVSEEVAQTFDKCVRGARKDGSGRTNGLKALLKRIETTSALQASAASRSVVGPKYFNAGTSKGDASKSASVGIPSGTLTGLEDTAGALRSHLTVVKRELDSDATLSSSGAESNDEAVVYNNPHQQPMPIEKRALWSWQRARASIASRWGWLQAQVQELEYKIRQHADLHRQVRSAKGTIEFEGEPAAYEGPLPGDAEVDSCARVRPLKRESFKKRKLLQMHNLHTATEKAAKPADVRCGCLHPVESCAVCTGRPVSLEPLPAWSCLPPAQRLARAQPAHHPVLSDVRDISPSMHLSALSSRAWFRSRAWRAGRPQRAPARPPRRPPPPDPPVRRLKRGRPPLSRKLRERERLHADDDAASSHERTPRPRASTESRARPHSAYDIDNIVIPQSVAANTRPEILLYKEIITPKWRVMEVPEEPLNNGVSKEHYNYYRHSLSDSEDEDISDAAVKARHIRSEVSERSRFLQKQRSRRAHAGTEGDAPPPAPAPVLPLVPHETVKPYSPRQFPLPDTTYTDMLSAMPDGHRHASPEPSTPTNNDNDHDEDMESLSLSPMSPLVFEGDDPDDVEWDPMREKGERRKSHAYR
ncbi:KAT8 regulatory NSL complex subunit 1 isoform X2 [Plutella xylostella]|uniref:KAT8 regulatory NSL complex subunit 1 isoform X2 n=1 Tax=Plutella xylostella TaxID=51655 RepID=UPI002032572A|nr:KAT8 regulatory NSL complex subunit 1 isoform X2 [Plutella xylostella]